MSRKSLAIVTWTIAICVCLLSRSGYAISIDGNGYEFTVAISEDACNVTEAERQPLLDALKDTLTKTSKLLFEATDHTVYFKKVNIVVPRDWSIQGTVIPTDKYSYVNADMRIEKTVKDSITIDKIRTYNSKMCGKPGEYIIAPPQLFLNSSYSNKFGEIPKVILHEFAHYRYGVHDENGFPDETVENGDKFPYSFINSHGDWQLTGCNNTEIKGSFIDSQTKWTNCTLPSVNCLFYPDLTASVGPVSSLMHMHFVPTVSAFCDSTNHDATASNKQNYWCRNRSVKTVIKQSPDLYGKNPIDSTTNTAPQFTYMVRAYQTVYIVFDTSTHTMQDPTVFNYTKNQVSQTLIPQLASASGRSFVGIAVMGGTNNNNTNGLLGGYLKEEQSPIQIGITNNQQILQTKVNGLSPSGSGLLLDKAMLDVADAMTPFAHLSGSIALIIKLNDPTALEQMKIEADSINLLNSRNVRLISFEYSLQSSNTVLQRPTELSTGYHFPANSGDYTIVFQNAVTKTIDLVKETMFRNRRIPLVRESFNTTNHRGYYNIDYLAGTVFLEVNFYVPLSADNYAIQVNNTNGMSYTLGSSEHTEKRSWDGKYKIHVFKFEAAKSSTTTRFQIQSSSSRIEGFVEVIEILDNSAPLYIGGGGAPNARPVEVEVFTSGDNGLLNMAAPYEDNSFLIFATARKGYPVARGLYKAIATVHASNGMEYTVQLRDDGLYPDLLSRDGIYSGFFLPSKSPSSGKYRISVLLDGYRASNPLAMFAHNINKRSLSIDQESYCCGSTYKDSTIAATFQRVLPYVASVDIKSANFYRARPLRILNFKIVNYDNVTEQVTFSWTSPTARYGTNETVASYRLVYSPYPNSIINEQGEIPQTATTVNSSQFIIGSLTPLPPYETHTVTIQLERNEPEPYALYFTINSKTTDSLGDIESYPAPMVYLYGSTREPETTTTSTTTTTTSTTTSTTTPTPTSTTTKMTMPTTTTTPTTTASTTKAATISTTTDPNSAHHLTVSSFSYLLFLFSICLCI